MTQIAAWRGLETGVLGFWHHGIECTDGWIIHFDGRGITGKKTAEIIRTSMEEFLKKSSCVYDVIYDEQVFDPEVVTERARSKLGQRGYHLAFNNCESFAKWCMTDKNESEQIQHYQSGALVGKKLMGYPGVLIGFGCAAVTQKHFRRKMIKRNASSSQSESVGSSEDSPILKASSQTEEGTQQSESVQPPTNVQQS